MRDWTMDQVILAPGAATKDLDLRKTEIEALRKENEELRAGIGKLSRIKVGTLAGIKKRLASLLDIGGA